MQISNDHPLIDEWDYLSAKSYNLLICPMRDDIV